MPFTPDTAHTGTQWKPGQSGNPTGPKPGYKHISTWIQEILNDEEFETTLIDAKQGIVEFKGAPLQAIIKSQLHLALHSKDENVRLKAADLLGKYGYGTKQTLANDTENPLIATTNPEQAASYAEWLKSKA